MKYWEIIADNLSKAGVRLSGIPMSPVITTTCATVALIASEDNNERKRLRALTENTRLHEHSKPSKRFLLS
jgi:hypothetical protein